ncbi:MAG: VOC family protein [Chloroflexi bacterium]|nr:VOC family protein [Chloroflexota bacterium]
MIWLRAADGQRAFYVHDPEGNRLEFTTRNGLRPSNLVVDEMGRTSAPPGPD